MNKWNGLMERKIDDREEGRERVVRESGERQDEGEQTRKIERGTDMKRQLRNDFVANKLIDTTSELLEQKVSSLLSRYQN